MRFADPKLLSAKAESPDRGAAEPAGQDGNRSKAQAMSR